MSFAYAGEPWAAEASEGEGEGDASLLVRHLPALPSTSSVLDFSSRLSTQLAGTLQSAAAVRVLNLSRCGLEKVPELPPTVEQLDLSHNRISEIDFADSLDKLELLNLAHNEITGLRGLQRCRLLQQLSVAYNHLADVGELPLLINLRVLDVRGNQFHSFDVLRPLSLLSRLVRIFLADNPVSGRVGYRVKITHLLPSLQDLDGISAKKKVDVDKMNPRPQPIRPDACFVNLSAAKRAPPPPQGSAAAPTRQKTSPLPEPATAQSLLGSALTVMRTRYARSFQSVWREVLGSSQRPAAPLSRVLHYLENQEVVPSLVSFDEARSQLEECSSQQLQQERALAAADGMQFLARIATLCHVRFRTDVDFSTVSSAVGTVLRRLTIRQHRGTAPYDNRAAPLLSRGTSVQSESAVESKSVSADVFDRLSRKSTQSFAFKAKVKHAQPLTSPVSVGRRQATSPSNRSDMSLRRRAHTGIHSSAQSSQTRTLPLKRGESRRSVQDVDWYGEPTEDPYLEVEEQQAPEPDTTAADLTPQLPPTPTPETVPSQVAPEVRQMIAELNDKINKLYNWHLVEIDLVSKQQLQLNTIRTELSSSRLSVSSQQGPCPATPSRQQESIHGSNQNEPLCRAEGPDSKDASSNRAAPAQFARLPSRSQSSPPAPAPLPLPLPADHGGDSGEISEARYSVPALQRCLWLLEREGQADTEESRALRTLLRRQEGLLGHHQPQLQQHQQQPTSALSLSSPRSLSASGPSESNLSAHGRSTSSPLNSGQAGQRVFTFKPLKSAPASQPHAPFNAAEDVQLRQSPLSALPQPLEQWTAMLEDELENVQSALRAMLEFTAGAVTATLCEKIDELEARLHARSIFAPFVLTPAAVEALSGCTAETGSVARAYIKRLSETKQLLFQFLQLYHQGALSSRRGTEYRERVLQSALLAPAEPRQDFAAAERHSYMEHSRRAGAVDYGLSQSESAASTAQAAVNHARRSEPRATSSLPAQHHSTSSLQAQHFSQQPQLQQQPITPLVKGASGLSFGTASLSPCDEPRPEQLVLIHPHQLHQPELPSRMPLTASESGFSRSSAAGSRGDDKGFWADGEDIGQDDRSEISVRRQRLAKAVADAVAEQAARQAVGKAEIIEEEHERIKHMENVRYALALEARQRMLLQQQQQQQQMLHSFPHSLSGCGSLAVPASVAPSATVPVTASPTPIDTPLLIPATPAQQQVCPPTGTIAADHTDVVAGVQSRNAPVDRVNASTMEEKTSLSSVLDNPSSAATVVHNTPSAATASSNSDAQLPQGNVVPSDVAPGRDRAASKGGPRDRLPALALPVFADGARDDVDNPAPMAALSASLGLMIGKAPSPRALSLSSAVLSERREKREGSPRSARSDASDNLPDPPAANAAGSRSHSPQKSPRQFFSRLPTSLGSPAVAAPASALPAVPPQLEEKGADVRSCTSDQPRAPAIRIIPEAVVSGLLGVSGALPAGSAPGSAAAVPRRVSDSSRPASGDIALSSPRRSSNLTAGGASHCASAWSSPDGNASVVSLRSNPALDEQDNLQADAEDADARSQVSLELSSTHSADMGISEPRQS